MHTLRKLQVLFTITDICHVYGSFLIQSQSNQDGGFLRYQVGLNQLPADILHDVVAGATKQLKVDVYVQDYDVTFRNWSVGDHPVTTTFLIIGSSPDRCEFEIMSIDLGQRINQTLSLDILPTFDIREKVINHTIDYIMADVTTYGTVNCFSNWSLVPEDQTIGELFSTFS